MIAPQIKTWNERHGVDGHVSDCMIAEITELRAALVELTAELAVAEAAMYYRGLKIDALEAKAVSHD